MIKGTQWEEARKRALEEFKIEERDCEHCVHRKDKGCEKWNCEFERREEC